MSVRAFPDTNVFLYAVDREDRRKRATADALIGRAINRKTGVVSYQVVQQFLNVALKKFAVPFTTEQARLYIGAVFRPLIRGAALDGIVQRCPRHSFTPPSLLV
jgi:predicted nucleic acid-binding protein